ncbi:unnamed protein product [marine sediment metagenome]|uniref:Glycosyltransferase 2-like domain-containing protein n=1 Tax=marine sediment metagenome TaxID=412755 RepID=X1GPN7_9ZZZZ
MWGGKPHNNNCILPVKQWKRESSQGNRVSELFGAFDTQEEQYKAGWDYIKREFGDSYVLIIDSDEVWEDKDLEKLKERVRQNPDYGAYHCALRTYVKSPFYRISPPERCRPTVVVNGHKVEQILGVRGNGINPILWMDDVFMHHFSYVRSSEDAILEKMQYLSLGDKDDYHKNWFEKYWEKIPNVHNFHPTIGEESSWKSLETVTLNDLPLAVRDNDLVKNGNK